MNGLVVFGKEIREILRTSRVYVLPGLFLFFGLTSPILTKMMPDIIKSFGTSAGGGVVIQVPPQTAVDSFLQFFKNVTQIGILAIILTTMGSVAEEKRSGTALLVVTKPVSRQAFVAAKFGAEALLVTFAVALGFAATLYYTVLLFADVPVRESIQAALLLLAYALFVVAMTVGLSAMARNQVVAAGVSAGGFALASILASLGGTLARCSPSSLATHAAGILTGSSTMADAAGPLAWAAGLSILLVVVGGRVFSRQEL